MEGAVKGVSRIRKSLSEACVGVMTWRALAGFECCTWGV